MSSFDYHATVPHGYTTAATLATEYKRSVAGVRFRMRYDHVPTIRLERRNAAGLPLGGHKMLAYHAAEAHAALQRPQSTRSSSGTPGYIGRLAQHFGLTRCQVREILSAAGVAAVGRVCPCCGKPTLFYAARPAAHAAITAYLRRTPK